MQIIPAVIQRFKGKDDWWTAVAQSEEDDLVAGLVFEGENR